MAFELPELTYDYSALEPHIDARTMEIHHGKHHAGYVKNLNAALEGHDDLLGMGIEDLLSNIEKVPEDKRQAVVNNGGGHANHSLFWSILRPSEANGEGGMGPSNELASAIDSSFGSFDEFKKTFTEKASTVFGSGWAFLIVNKQGKLECKRHSFQNSPYLNGNIPILGLDVWEHAYYLKYQNMRADYIAAWWNIVNWEQVAKNFKTAK